MAWGIGRQCRCRCREVAVGVGVRRRATLRCGSMGRTREGRRVHVSRFLSARRVFSRNFRVGPSNPGLQNENRRVSVGVGLGRSTPTEKFLYLHSIPKITWESWFRGSE
jgi:hypothetical protein